MSGKNHAVSFTVKKKFKNPFQTQKQKEEAKKRRLEEETAAVFEDFVASFQDGDRRDRPKQGGFVAGGTVQPGSRHDSATDSGIPGPSSKARSLPGLSKGLAGLEAAFPRPGASPRAKPVVEQDSVFTGPASKGRKIDLVLQNIQRDAEKREERNKLRAMGYTVEDEMDPGLGSLDDGDPTTTNLYVSPLHMEVNEDMLKAEFGRYGPLASVKIMWPRGADIGRKTHNCGFVAFMRREDAEVAKAKLDYAVLKGAEIRIGWGKSVPIPSYPIHVVGRMGSHGAGLDVDPSPSGTPHAIAAPHGVGTPHATFLPGPPGLGAGPAGLGAGPPGVGAGGPGGFGSGPPGLGSGLPGLGAGPPGSDHHDYSHGRDPDRHDNYDQRGDRYHHGDHDRDHGYDRGDRYDRSDHGYDRHESRGRRGRSPDAWHKGVGPDIVVSAPEDPRQRWIIDSMASFVLKDGTDFEQVIMEREAANPEFAFLFNVQLPEHAYYRWRVYSLANEDSMRTWRTEPFVLLEGGPRFVPPSMMERSTDMRASTLTAAQRSAAAGAGVADTDRPLTDLEAEKLQEMLRALTLERADIANAMVFCLENAEAAGEICDTLHDALTLPETPVPKKVARLCLVSDLLHNASAPVKNATRYRMRLETVLPSIFEGLNGTLRCQTSLVTQGVLRKMVIRVLRVWREWYVFSSDFLNGLQAAFLRPPKSVDLMAGNPELAEELQALPAEELSNRCKAKGLVAKGEAKELVERLLALDLYLHGSRAPAPARKKDDSPPAQPDADAEPNTPPTSEPSTPPVNPTPPAAEPAAEQPAEEGAGDGETKAVVVDDGTCQTTRTAVEGQVVKVPLTSEPASRWTTVDEEEEEKPQGPISKWIEQTEAERIAREEAEAAEKALEAAEQAREAAEEAAAAGGWQLEAGEISPEADSSPERPTVTAVDTGAPVPSTPAGGGDQIDDARREQLRKIEVQCLVLREDLHEEGCGVGAVEAQVSALRAKLIAELDAANPSTSTPRTQPASRATDDSRDRDRGRRQSSGSRKDRDRDRDRDRDGRSGGGGSSRRDRRDGERDRERDRDRDRARDRAKREDRGSKSSSRRDEKSSSGRSRTSKADDRKGRSSDRKRSRSRSRDRKDKRRKD